MTKHKVELTLASETTNPEKSATVLECEGAAQLTELIGKFLYERIAEYVWRRDVTTKETQIISLTVKPWIG